MQVILGAQNGSTFSKKQDVFKCPTCNYTSKKKFNTARHMWEIHGLGKGRDYACTHCSFATKRYFKLQRHMWESHDVGKQAIYKCSYCHFTSKRRSRLKRHLEFIHDIGLYMCDVCQRCRNTAMQYKDTQGTHSACRACFNKLTGKQSRIEKIWSDYLDDQIGKLYLIGSDSALRSLGGCSMKRPDKMYAGIHMVEIDECDEHQHMHDNGNYSCEEQRLMEIYDEPSICGKKMVVIRWNPHSYRPPVGYQKESLEARLCMIVSLKTTLRHNPPTDPITVFYMFYNEDNPHLTRNIPKVMIYSYSDIDALKLKNSK